MGKDLNGKELGKGIIQLADKRYRATFVDPNDLAKKINRIYSKSLEDIKHQLYVSRAYFLEAKSEKDKKITLDDFFALWINQKSTQLAGNTLSNYFYAYKHVSNAMGFKQISEITTLDFRELFGDLIEQGYQEGQINKIKMVTKQILEKARENNIISVNPLPSNIKDVVSFSQVNNSSGIKAMSEIEQKCYINYIFEIDHKLKEMISFLLLTGLRIGEAIALTWDNIDKENMILNVTKGMREYYQDGQKIIEIDKPKEEYSRCIPLLNATLEVLEKQRELHAKANEDTIAKYGNLIFTDDGNMWTHAIFSYQLKCIKQEMIDQDIPMCNVTPHVFRHTFITRCVESGMNPNAIAKIVGHKSIEITMNRYTTLSKEFLQESIDKISITEKK